MSTHKRFSKVFFKSFYYFYILLNLIHGTQGARTFDIWLTNLTYVLQDKAAFTYFEITLQELPSGRKTMHMDFALNETLPEFGGILDIKVLRQHKTWGRLMQLKLNGCDFLSAGFKGDRVSKNVIRALRYGNSVIPQQCPLEAHQRIVVDRFYLHAEDFPPVLPETQVFANFSLIVKKKLWFSILLDFEFTRNAPQPVALKLF